MNSVYDKINQSLDIFLNNLSVERLEEFCLLITKSTLPIEEKKNLYSKAFNSVEKYSKYDELLNFWAIASMLEDPNLEVVNKIAPFRDALKNEEIDIKTKEKWVQAIYTAKNAPRDMLEFLAMDVRHYKGFSDKTYLLIEEYST